MTRPLELGSPIVHLGTVTSTMDIARDLERLGATDGITVLAERQTQGRGRSGRTWESPVGRGLYCSILLRPCIPASEFRSFSIAVGLALCDAFDPGNRLGLTLKWPNDILAGDRKLAGILITTNLAGEIVDSSILGIGLNLAPDPTQPVCAAALSEIEEATRQTSKSVLASIIAAVRMRYAALLDGEIEGVLAGWTDRLAYRGRFVTIQDGSAQLTGRLIGIDSAGALLLETDPGKVSTISTGELQRGPRPA